MTHIQLFDLVELLQLYQVEKVVVGKNKDLYVGEFGHERELFYLQVGQVREFKY